MYCTNCGKQISDDAQFCKFCGAPTANQRDADAPQQEKSTDQQQPKKSKKGLILGIVFGALFLCLVGTGITLFATGYAQKQIIMFRIEKYTKNFEYDKLIECYEELLELDDTDEDTYISLAYLYMAIGDVDAAANVLKRGAKRIDDLSDEFYDLYDEVLAKLEDGSGIKEANGADGETGGSGGQGMSAAAEELAPYDRLRQGAADRTSVNVTVVSTDVSDFPLVRIYLDVTDSYGEQIELITPQGAIKEAVSGGQFVEREVKRIEKLEGNEGLSIELIADKSGSMDWRMDQVKEVMSQFVNSLDYASGDQVELIAFDSYVMYMCTRTDNVDLLDNGIYNMVPTGSTALYDALYEGVINAGLQPGARCVIAFTDGDDNVSAHTYQEIINLAKQSSVAIYVIGTDKYAEDALQNIALSTNGYYWYIDDLADMGVIFDEIYEEQKDLYCLEYESDGSLEQYAQRTVDFIVEDNSVVAALTDSFTPVETLQVQEHTSRYEIIAADVSWTEANTECILRGGHLATITSEDEMNQLIQMAEASGLKYLWIGGYTSVSGYQAFGHWVTGEPFSYTAWYDGEPSRNDMDGTPEMYIMMWKLKDEWSWNDQRNDPAAELSYFLGNIGYICEYEE